jgi:hypothetical protein
MEGGDLYTTATRNEPITGRNPMNQSQWRHNFSPEVHVLAGTLVPVVSTYTSWFSS